MSADEAVRTPAAGPRRWRRRADLHTLVADVVESGNCSGCGACAALSPSLRMDIVDESWVRPVVEPGRPVPDGAARRFRRICPGRSVTAPPLPPGAGRHPVFGRHVSVWAAWAVDGPTRERGSSGGVLTALSAFLLERGDARSAVAVTESAQRPGRTVAVEIRRPDGALAAAGSRYAPVATVAALDVDSPADILVGKPCEVDAAQRLLSDVPSPRPLLLSFFCAGVPSQRATTELVTELGVDLADGGSVRYRGQGWPGDFVATAADGTTGRMPYEQAWGQRLGRDIQSRCKICPEATGEHADVAVGDFWTVDERGYPVFTEGDGTSVAIARTPRGHELLLAAEREGVLSLRPVELEQVAAVQPTQVRRRNELLGRLVGRRLAGRPVPRYRGFGLLTIGLRRPRPTLRAARGTYGRAREEIRMTQEGSC